MKLSLGTKSLLFGSHQFILHPLMVAYGWRRHYGCWPPTWRAWVLITCHDLGYLGCETMDGPDGKHHPDRGARLIARICACNQPGDPPEYRGMLRGMSYNFWWKVAAGHSRSFAELAGIPISPLMIPDKLATALLPRWLYALLVWLSGEWKEYVAYAVASGHDVPGDAWGYAGWIKGHWAAQFDREGRG